MKNNDLIQRFIIENANVRGEIVHIQNSFQTIMQQHQYPLPIQKILGEMLVAASLLSSIIKFQGHLTVQFQGKGALRLLMAQSTHEFNMRGLAQWEGDLSEEELLSELKKGLLGIIIKPDKLVKGYQGIVAWQGDTLAESIEGYFKNSEQIETRLWFAINETQAAGLLLQPMPEEGTKKTQPIKGDLGWDHVIHLTNTITPEELLSLDNQTLLHRLYSQEDVAVFEPAPIKFQCNCSIERGENAIRLLGEEEANEELNAKQKIVVTCEFCNKEYSFDRVDVSNIFKKSDPSSPNHLH